MSEAASVVDDDDKEDPTRQDIIIGPCRACGMDGTLDRELKTCVRWVVPKDKLFAKPQRYRPERCIVSAAKQEQWSINV